MRALFIFLIALSLKTPSFGTPIDTIDYWTVRVNGKPLVMYDHPMNIDLSFFNDNDTIEICYWTDHGTERLKWQYIFEDSNNSPIESFTNPIDSTLDRKHLNWRKNYIAFTVEYLRRLLSEKSLTNIFVQFELDQVSEPNPYKRKPICVISKN